MNSNMFASRKRRVLKLTRDCHYNGKACAKGSVVITDDPRVQSDLLASGSARELKGSEAKGAKEELIPLENLRKKSSKKAGSKILGRD